MDAYAGEVQSMHPFYAFDSPARANDMDLATTKAVRCFLSPFLCLANQNTVCPPRKHHRRYPAWLLDNAHEAGHSPES